MYNSDKLGGNDADAYRWAQNAANECFKEIAANKGSHVAGQSDDSGGSASIIILLLLLGGFSYMVFRPRVATESEARNAYKKIAELCKENVNDHPAIRRYKREVLEGLDEGLSYILQQIKERNEFVTQYFIKETVKKGVAELRMREEEVRSTGKIKPEIAWKICKGCRTFNEVSDTVCTSCGIPLPTVDETIANIERIEAQQDRDQILIDEQENALRNGLIEFGFLIEKRAKLLGESYLAAVCYAYISGKLKYHSPSVYFSDFDRNRIYTRSKGDELFGDVQFPIDVERAKRMAYESIKSIYTSNTDSRRKEKIWDDKIRRVYGWADLFFKSKQNGEAGSFSPLYSFIAEVDVDLFSKVQESIAKWEIERHVKYDKKPYSSAGDYLKQKVPFSEKLSDIFIEECRLLGESFFEEKRIRKEKRAEKRKSNQNP